MEIAISPRLARGFAFVSTKAVACQEKKTDFRGTQIKGYLREGAPDEVG